MDPAMMSAMLQNITPEMMDQIVNSNPMLKGMVDSNPQLKAIFSNPALMQQMMSIILFYI
jgi:ubiquilin